MNIDNLSLKERIGQRFIVGINNENVDDVIKLVKDAYIGGVILYKKNYHDYKEMITLIKKIKEANKENKIPLFIAIDEEGGKVNRLPLEIHNLKNIYDVSKYDISLVVDYANIIGRILQKSGINMNLAPVVDMDNGSSARSLFKRCFYGEEDKIIEAANKYLTGLNNMVIPVIKHYPGHGLTTKDTHFIVPYIANLNKLKRHVKPFNELIKKDIDALMVGHLVIRKLTNLLPASISNKFLENLRKDYHGLIITDEINMLRRQLFYHFIYVNKALKASSDIILLKIKDTNEYAKIVKKYMSILEKDNKYQNKLDASIKRIIKVKEKYQISDNTDILGIDIKEINKEIDELNEKIINA